MYLNSRQLAALKTLRPLTAAKRPLFKTIDSVKDVQQADNTIVHSIIVNVSAKKKGSSKQFFKAKSTDGERQVHVIGFTPGQQKQL